MRATSIRVMAVAAVSALLFASCGGSDAVSPATYAESMCTSVNDWVTAIQERASGLEGELTGEAAQAKDKLDEFFGVAIDATDTLIAELGEAGAPDVEGGEGLAGDLIETFEKAKAALEEARGKVADLPEDDPQAFMEQSTALGTDIQTAMNDLGSTMEDAPDALTEATLDEPACQQLTG